MNRGYLALVLGGAALAACQSQPPAPAARAGAPPAIAASPAAASAAGALPAGHPPVSGTGSATDPSKVISGQIVAAPALASKLAGKTALFIIARDPASQQIVAVRKEEVASWPFPFTISEADGMMAGDTKFEGTVDLTARVSRGGDAMPAAGDIEGFAKGVKVPSRDAKITLDTVRP